MVRIYKYSMFVIDPKIDIKSCHCGLSAILPKKDSLRVVDRIKCGMTALIIYKSLENLKYG